MTIAQQLHSAWFNRAAGYSDYPLRPKLDPSNTTSINPTPWNNFWFGGASSYAAPQRPGPGVSPDTRYQFFAQPPQNLSNFIPNIVLPLTGQSITSTAGTVGQTFGGQAIVSSTGILTPSITVALFADGQWQSPPPFLGPWLGGSTGPGPGQLLPSAWPKFTYVNYSDQLLRQKLDPANTLSATAPFTNFWWTTTSAEGAWFGPTTQPVVSTAGTMLPFGVSGITLYPATIRNAGPGVGPYTNGMFVPQLPGFVFATIQPLTGTAIVSTAGTLTASNTGSAPLTGISAVFSLGTVVPILGGVVPLGGESFTATPGDLSQAAGLSIPLFGTLASFTAGTLTFVLPPGPGGEYWTTIQALLQAGLIPQTYYSTSQTIPAGFVISLTPPVGTVVPVNSAVVVLVSTGPGGSAGSVLVPNVVGLYWLDATTALEAAFISNDKYLWQINAAAVGTVLAQSLPAGSMVAPGSIIQLTLSAGPSRVVPTVPVP